MPTKIEWAEESWNPITGCSPVSEGCQNCYARRMASRLRGRFGYPQDEPFKVTFHPDRLDEPLKWKKPRRVFVCSMGDLFHERIQPVLQRIIFNQFDLSPQHTFLVLTKRPHIMKETLCDNIMFMDQPKPNEFVPHVWPNVWLGVTAENQQRADERIPILLQIPAAKRFVSIEPMLGPTILQGGGEGYLDRYYLDNPYGGNTLDWVIVGGESGPGARPMHPDWIRSVRDQCQAAGADFFFKQWGSHWYRDWLPTLPVKEAGLDTQYYKGGRLLDGREWNEMLEGNTPS